jgi:two-component system, cell cycle response regulator DivK
VSNQLILIVDDDASSRLLLTDALQLTGYRTMEAHTGEEALELARAFAPDLVLMDIKLPRMSGVEALRRLRLDEPTRALPVVAVSASVMDNQRQEVMEAGFDAFVPKPLNVARLLSTVQALLHRDRG